MIRRAIAAVALIPFLSSTARCDEKEELKKLEGTWLPSAAEFGGQKWSDEQIKAIKLVMSDGKYTATVSGQDDKGTLKVDPNAKPEDASQHARFYPPTATKPAVIVATVPAMDEPAPRPVPQDLDEHRDALGHQTGFVAGWVVTVGDAQRLGIVP